jgi:cytochrome c5
MRANPLCSLLFAAACLCAGAAATAQTATTGEQVYRQVCVVCHAAGVAKAPKFGDRGMWAPLIKEGQSKLTADAWIGVRGMPAQGGKPDLALEEFSRAVAYMARAGGATWNDPDAAMLANIRKRVAARQEAGKARK